MKNRLFFSCILFAISVHAESKYPVDISFLVADLKYSQEHGVKICEVQHGSLSALEGDLSISGGDGSISPKIADFFTQFPVKKWAVGLIYPPLRRSFAAKGWDFKHSINTLLKDPNFIECAAEGFGAPSSISLCSGIVYDDFDLFRNLSAYQKSYPGILFMNAATFPYWKDKFKMNTLFDQNTELKQFKADWKLYPKKYDSLLSERIHEELPSELYVIKPRGEELAKGVIVVANDDLDAVLKMILAPSPSLEKNPNKNYSYWGKNRDDTFIIEKYYESDFLSFEEGHHYDATLRLVFILQHEKEKMAYHCLGGFWKLPSKALEEEGTLDEKRLSFCKAPFYRGIDSETFNKINMQMERAMLLLYEAMLNGCSY